MAFSISPYLPPDKKALVSSILFITAPSGEDRESPGACMSHCRRTTREWAMHGGYMGAKKIDTMIGLDDQLGTSHHVTVQTRKNVVVFVCPPNGFLCQRTSCRLSKKSFSSRPAEHVLRPTCARALSHYKPYSYAGRQRPQHRRRTLSLRGALFY